MKVMQIGYYDILFATGLVLIGFSAFSIVEDRGHYEILGVLVHLAMSLVLFLFSWVTLFLFTRDILGSAVSSARTAGVYFGLSAVRMAAVLLLVGSTLDGLLPAICLTELVAVSVGMTYLHSLDGKKGVVCGLIISVAVIAFLIAVIAFAGP